MLTRVPLSPQEAQALCAALAAEDPALLWVENSVNLTTVLGFLGTRFLTLPPIEAHGQVDGEEYDWSVMLMKGSQGFVVLEQIARQGDETYAAGGSVQASLVLRSSLPFALEDGQNGLACRIRQTLLEVGDWTLQAGRARMHSAAKFPGRPLWEAIAGPVGDSTLLRGALPDLRAVWAGRTTVAERWQDWANDAKAAEAELQESMAWRATLAQMLATGSGAPPSARGP